MNPVTLPDDASENSRAVNIFLIILCMSFQVISLSGISLFLPVIRSDLGFSFTQGGTLSAITFFVYALMQIPAGFLADRFGMKKIFFIGVLGTTAFCLIFGLASQYWQALLTQMGSGFFRSFIFAAGLALLASWFGPQRRATAMGLSLIGMYSGQLVINAAGPALENHFSWRFPFIAFAIVGILASFAFLWFGKESSSSNFGSKQKVNTADVFGLFRYRFMWVCGGLQYIRLGVMQGTTFWLPSLLIDEKGLSLQVTGLIIALRALLTAPSSMVGGYISDKLKRPAAVMASSLVMLTVTTVMIVKIDNVTLLIALVFINALFIQFYFGPLFAIPVERYGSHMTGTLTGFGNFFANLGGFTFSYLLGVLKDKTGYFESGFYCIAAACALGLVFVFLLEKMRYSTADQEN